MRIPRVPAQTRADQKLFAIWFVKTICYLVQRKLFAIWPASRCWAHRHSQPAAFAWTGVLGRKQLGKVDKFQELTQDELSVNKRIANVRSRIEQVCE